MIGNEEGTGDTSTLNPAPLGPPKNPSRNGYTPPTHRYNPKPMPRNENLSTISSGHPHSCLKTHKVVVAVTRSPRQRPGPRTGQQCRRCRAGRVAAGPASSRHLSPKTKRLLGAAAIVVVVLLAALDWSA